MQLPGPYSQLARVAIQAGAYLDVSPSRVPIAPPPPPAARPDSGLLLPIAPILAPVGAANLAELPAWASDLLEDARVARLGLLDEEGRPRVLPVTFALAEGRIWSAVDEKPKRVPAGELARVRFLRRDPRAALTVDRYSDDWDDLAWVQVLGVIRIVETHAADAGLASLIAKYEPYRQSPPPGPLLSLDPERCLFWRSSSGE